MRIFVLVDGKPKGPFDLPLLTEALRKGEVFPSSLASVNDDSRWRELRQIPELEPLLSDQVLEKSGESQNRQSADSDWSDLEDWTTVERIPDPPPCTSKPPGSETSIETVSAQTLKPPTTTHEAELAKPEASVAGRAEDDYFQLKVRIPGKLFRVLVLGLVCVCGLLWGARTWLGSKSPVPPPPTQALHEPAATSQSVPVEAPETKVSTERLSNSSATQATSQAASQEKPSAPPSAAVWVNSLGMKFVNVPGTRVLFSVWKTRVQDFAKFVAASRYDATRGMLSIRKGVWGAHGNSWRTPPFSQDPTHPVCGVSWIDAKAFCEWLTKKERLERLLTPTQSYRLPHEAEWNAAVGTAKFPWGEEWPPPSWAGNFAGREVQDGNWPKWAVLANHRDPYPRTSPVGSFAANRYGIYDLGGNLWEWCQEPFGSNPKVRVLRGSSWMANYPDYLLSSARRSYTADCRRDDAGFRIVLAKTEEMKP